MKLSFGTPLLAAGVLAWVLALGAGFGVLWRYQRGAGEAAEARSMWPSGSTLPRNAGRPLVLQFVHPRCPCSRATLTELKGLVERLPGRPPVLILFARPAGVEEGWERTGTWDQAKAIPGANVLADIDGREFERFGAKTSGQTFVYGANGELLFSGGITPARGEVGQNAGRERVAAILKGLTPERRDSLVYGCALEEPEKK